MNRLIIRYRLPSLNDVIDENRRDKHEGNRLKREVQDIIGQYIRVSRSKKLLAPVTTEGNVVFIEWHEANRKRDVDNVQSSVKFILDALVVHKILPNDTRRWVEQVHHKVVDSDESGAVVYIMTRDEWEAAKYQLI